MKELEKQEEEEDWDSTRQNQKEQELESEKISKSDPETIFPFENSDIKVDTPQITDTLIEALPILPQGEEKQTEEQYNSDHSEFIWINPNGDSGIDNIV